MHIVKSPGVGRKAIDLHGGPTVHAGSCFQFLLIEVIVLNHVGINTIVIGFVRTDGGFRIERGERPGTASVFPLRFGGQTIAIGTAVPAHTGSVNGICGGKPLLFTAGVAVGYRIQPGDIFHRQVFTGKIAGVVARYVPVFLLRHLIGAHIKITD